jgi:hypothetical protein
MLPGEGRVRAVYLHQHIAVLRLVVDELRRPWVTVTRIITQPRVQGCPGCPSHNLMKVVAEVAIAVVNLGVMIHMSVSGEVDSSPFSGYAVPKSTSLASVILKSHTVPGAKWEYRFVSEREDVRLRVQLKLFV